MTGAPDETSSNGSPSSQVCAEPVLCIASFQPVCDSHAPHQVQRLNKIAGRENIGIALLLQGALAPVSHLFTLTQHPH